MFFTSPAKQLGQIHKNYLILLALLVTVKGMIVSEYMFFIERLLRDYKSYLEKCRRNIFSYFSVSEI